MIKKLVQATLLSTAILFIFTGTAAAQNNAAAIAAADTSRFSVNAEGGWQLFNSYVESYKADSAQLELIVQHSNINLAQEQYLGRIKDAALRPSTAQNLAFSLLSDNYTLRVDADGKCYLRWLTAPAAAAEGPVILPLKVYYKL